MTNITIPFLDRVSLKDKAIFARQLATMLKAGLQLAFSLEILAKQTRKIYFRTIITEIHHDLKEGKSFSSLVARFPNIFDPVFVSIVRAGEQSGQLELVLSQLAKQLADQYAFVSKMKTALIYPAFVTVAMIGVAMLASVKVIPQLKGVFEESKVPLPLSTKIVIGFSDFLIHYWYLVILAAVLLVVGYRLLVRSREGRLLVDSLLLREPSGLAKRVYMARFTRTLGMMLGAGIPIVEAVGVVGDVIGNQIYKASLARTAQDLERGLPLSLSLQKDPIFPVFVSQMAIVGEQTGQIDKILIGLAEFYEEESETEVRNLSALFEPLLIVIIGVAIGFLVYSIIIPIYNLAAVQ